LRTATTLAQLWSFSALAAGGGDRALAAAGVLGDRDVARVTLPQTQQEQRVLHLT
jgi:hypothetical protein